MCRVVSCALAARLFLLLFVDSLVFVVKNKQEMFTPETMTRGESASFRERRKKLDNFHFSRPFDTLHSDSIFNPVSRGQSICSLKGNFSSLFTSSSSVCARLESFVVGEAGVRASETRKNIMKNWTQEKIWKKNLKNPYSWQPLRTMFVNLRQIDDEKWCLLWIVIMNWFS